MGVIRLIAARRTAAVDQVAERLVGHFGRSLVDRSDAAAAPGDVLVTFIQPHTGDGAADWTELADPRIERALADGAPVVPVLVDGVAMPSDDRLPASVRGLAYLHALPVRSDARLGRDVGRLIVDLESQLQHVVGNLFAYDFWLLPMGALLALFGAVYALVYVRDVTDWSFGYETLDGFRYGMRVLLLSGPGALGAGLLMIAAGVWWRRTRRGAARRAEYFRQATGGEPPADNAFAFGCLCAGAAAAGWGLIAGAIALTLAACALLTMRERPLGRAGAAAVVLGLAGAAVGSAWTTYYWRLEQRLGATIGDYEAGREEAAAERFVPARAKLQAAADRYPAYANAHLRLAELDLREERLAAALAAADRAVARYPAAAQSSFGPPQDVVAAAYELRAEVHERQGDPSLASRDRDMMGQVTGFMNIFGGIFRFWEIPPTDAAR
jgi:hypothetical protein